MKKLIFSAILLAGLAALVAPPVAFAQEDKPFTIHGEVRTRMEYTDNANDLTDSGTDVVPGPPGAVLGDFDDEANYWPYRIRIAAEGHFTKNITAWIEFQNSGVFGGDTNGPFKAGTAAGLTGSGVELYQGNITLNKLWSDNFSLTFGRTELVKGNELHLGDLDFYSGISHDGVIANWDLKKVDITGWYTRPFEDSVIHLDNSIPPGNVVVNNLPAIHHFWGAYVTFDVAKEQPLELYFMEMRDRDYTADSPATLDMIGARWSHSQMTKSGPVWNAEIAQQFGQLSDLPSGTSAGGTFESGADLSGMVFEGMFGWNFKGKNMLHQVYGQYEMATGNESDSDATLGDKEDEGFRPFFTDFHNRLGRGDWFQLTGGSPTSVGGGLAGTGGGGITAVSVGYQGMADRHSWGAAFWDYTLDQETDLDAGITTESLVDDLGTAWDLWYGFNYSKNLTFEASYSMLSAGDALTSNSTFVTPVPDDAVTRFYGQARLRF